MTFAEWLELNSVPTLAELIERHGGYAKIPANAWEVFDREMAWWHHRYRSRHLDEAGR
jgi:hypothetical protein